jgi:CRP-like cAMP-binding protein
MANTQKETDTPLTKGSYSTYQEKTDCKPKPTLASDVQKIIDSCPLLTGLDLKARHSCFKTLKSGQIITDSINGTPACGIVVFGMLDVYNVAADGHEVCLTRLEQGSCFGIANLFEDGSLKTVLKCRKQAKVLLFPKRLLISALENNLVLANRFLRFYNNRLDFLLQRIELLTMHSTCGKLIEYLLTQTTPEGNLELRVSRDDFARQLGASRAALYRELSRLQSLGLITVRGRHIQVIDPGGLERLAFQS